MVWRSGFTRLGQLLAATLLVIACGDGEAKRPPREVGGSVAPPRASAAAATTVAVVRISPEAARGRQLFLSYCISCHSTDGRGLQPMGIDLTTSRFIAAQSDAALVRFLKSGRGSDAPGNRTGRTMPGVAEVPDIGSAELQALVAHLREINSAS